MAMLILSNTFVCMLVLFYILSYSDLLKELILFL